MTIKDATRPHLFHFSFETRADTDEQILAYYRDWVPEFDVPGGIGDKVCMQRKWLNFGDFAVIPATGWKDCREGRRD
ncbi:MAG: hypothetical protein ACXVGQ_00360 [Mycobacteriaceae bacterium]